MTCFRDGRRSHGDSRAAGDECAANDLGNMESHPYGISSIIEVHRAGYAFEWISGAERFQVIADVLSIRAFLPDCISDEPGCIVRESRKCIGLCLVFALKCADEALDFGRWIFGVERSPDIGAV